jgi:uncharacterized protein YdeI (YjbR/CyaY-like superfamily)
MSSGTSIDTVAADLPVLNLPDIAAWRAWLAEHHGDPAGVWLVTAKKGTPGVSRDEALEEALCYGWIDGQARKNDDTTYLQRYTPRRRGSAWSQRNVKIVARLTAEGRMHEAGLAEVERAKADGRWDAAYAGSATIEVPDDLQAALDAEPNAKSMFESLNRQNRYAVLYRIETAKRAETRQRRIEKFVAMLARGETLY